MLGQTTEYNNNASNDTNDLNASSSNVRLKKVSTRRYLQSKPNIFLSEHYMQYTFWNKERWNIQYGRERTHLPLLETLRTIIDVNATVLDDIFS